MKYKTNGCNAVNANSMKEAAEIFAYRFARRTYGKNADVRTLNQNCYSVNGKTAEYNAFIGITKANETTGNNIHFVIETV